MGCGCDKTTATAWFVVHPDTGNCLVRNGTVCVEFSSAQGAASAAESAHLDLWAIRQMPKR